MNDDTIRQNLCDLINRAMSDGGAVIPIDALLDLLANGPRPVPETHEILFPGPSHTWLMRHPADCPKPCPHAIAARRQFPAHDGCFAPGEFVVRMNDFRDGRWYLTPTPIIRIGQPT